MRVVSLGSGSSGNALLIEAGPQGRTKLLVDAGLSGRLMVERLRLVGVDPSQLLGVLLTHEHSDHIVGLPSLMRRYAVSAIADPRTYKAFEEYLTSGLVRTDTGKLVSTLTEEEIAPMAPRKYLPLEVGSQRIIGDVEVTSFPVSHDAVAPCGYLLRAGGCRVCVAIDSGEVTSAMLEVMQHADLLVLESNHDRQRLLRGPYPYMLKQRILGTNGHLSNDQAADAVLRLWRSDGVRWLWLSHLSRTNNTPLLALTSMRTRLQEAKANPAQVHISVLPPAIGGVWDSTQLWHAPSLWEMSH